ncbi:MAG: cytochrome c [Deltaproteobacteria bacterium]|nr:cytochrome c [Deltaproteobacteria bacterium]
MYVLKQALARYSSLVITLILFALISTFSSSTLWGEDEIEVIERPLLADDMPAVRVKPSAEEHDHSKHKIRTPILLPGAEGKFQIGEIKGDPAEGEKIYKKGCAYCHGKKGVGDGITVIGLRVKPKSFTRKEGILKMKDQEIFDIITYGVKTNYQLNMPAWGPNLSIEERLNVLAYVKQLAAKTAREAGEKGADEEHTHSKHNGNHKH